MSDAPDKVVIYANKDGRPDIQLRVEGGTVWLTQAEIADLFALSTDYQDNREATGIFFAETQNKLI